MLANIGLPGLIVIAVVILVLFGRGRVSALMGEVGKGITSFRREIRAEEKVPAVAPVPVETARPKA